MIINYVYLVICKRFLLKRLEFLYYVAVLLVVFLLFTMYFVKFFIKISFLFLKNKIKNICKRFHLPMHAVSSKDMYEGNIVVYLMEVKNIEHVLRDLVFSHKFGSFS